MSKPRLKAPFPAIGGKGRVARLIWGHLGNVRNYCEPFCRSAAVLLARPHPGRIETINDVDHHVVNVWRAISADPEEVAEHADWPVTEADLHARHLWLMFGEGSAEFRERMKQDPDHYDARRAGWWIWGACCWIGSGWCDDTGKVLGERRPQLSNQVPDLSGDSGAYGRGVHASAGPTQKRPALSLGNSEHGKGVQAMVPRFDSRPQLADAFARGRGVHGNDHAGTCAERRAWLIDWMHRLQDRLRGVRVCCGDWARICSSHSVTTRLGLTGIFLDPPYALDIGRMHAFVEHYSGRGELPGKGKKSTNRDGNLYGSDRGDVDEMVARVHIYCRDWGAKKNIRIVLAGYEGEHDALVEQYGWEAIAWKASGYSNRGKSAANNSRERLWISPQCRCREAGIRPMYRLWEKETVAR